MRSVVAILASALSAGPALAQCGPYAVDPNTAALWHFEEGSGSIAFDSARHIGATLTGATFADSTAPFGSTRYALDVGPGRFASTSGLPVLNPHEGITVEAWIFPRTLEADHTSGIVRKNDTFGAENYSLELVGASQVRFAVNVAGAVRVAAASLTLQTSSWTHVAGTFDGTAVRIYVDGQLVATRTGPAGLIGGDSSPLFLGRGDAESSFDGLIDEVRISNRARAPEELHTAQRELELFTDRRTAHTGTRARAILHFAAPCGGAFSLDVTQESPTGALRILDRRARLVAPAGFDQTRTVRDHTFDGTEPSGTWRLHVVVRDADTGVLLHEETSSLQFTP
jgi:large repetitive protein